MLKANRKRFLIYTSLIVLFLLTICFAVSAFQIVNYGKKDEKKNADVAIVLGAGTSDEGVSPVYRERINHSIRLYENGYVEYLIFTGGFGDGNHNSDAYMAKQYALSQGIPENVILLEERSSITEENLEYAKVIMDERALHTAIIVSDPLHMKRAMLMAGDYGLKAWPSPTPTTMYRSLRTKFPFLLRETFFYMGYSVVRLFR